MILLRAEPESSACFRSHAENETMCSIRCDAHPPRRFRRDRRPPRPNRLHAAAGRVSSALVRVGHGFRLLPPLSTEGGGVDSRTKGKDRCGRIPRRGGSLSRSTCAPAQRETTWICADSAATVCFPTIEGIAFSTPRIKSRGCRQACICIGFLVSAPTPRVFPVSLPTPAKYEGVLRFGPRSPVSPHRI